MNAFTGNLNIISRCTQMQRNESLKELGICGGHVPYLLRLCRVPGLTQEEIARALYVNKSTAARAITNLEKAGFVERREHPEDKRCLQIFPTQKAVDALPAIRETLGFWNSYLLEEFTEEEQAVLLSMMERISARAKAYIKREEGWDT